MKKILFGMLLFVSTLMFSQVGIGTVMPDDSAMLDVTSTNSGLLIPRVSLVNVTDITTPINNPANGLMVYNTNATVVGGDGAGFYFFDGSWRPVSFSQNTLDQAYDEGGSGNGRTIQATHGPLEVQGVDGFLVSGTFGSGAAINSPGPGTRLQFNPRRASFRVGAVSGTQWDGANVANYSFATGLDNIASGARSFAAGIDNIASNLNAVAFGSNNISSGISSVTLGGNNTASGTASFAFGNFNNSTGRNSLVQGQNNDALTYNEVTIGSFARGYTATAADSDEVLYTTDRAFAVGIGSSAGTRANGLEVWKDGRVVVNEAYSLPTSNGTTGQVLTAGTGANNQAQWRDVAASTIPLFAADTNLTLNATSNTNLFEGALIPTLYSATGEVQLKLIMLYTSLTGGAEFQIRGDNGTGYINLIGYGQFNSSTPSATSTPFHATDSGGSGGIIETDWISYTAGTTPYQLLVRGRVNTGGDEIIITHAYVMVRGN